MSEGLPIVDFLRAFLYAFTLRRAGGVLPFRLVMLALPLPVIRQDLAADPAENTLVEQEIVKQEEEADGIEQFILRAKKHPDLEELTPAVLHDLVNEVYVFAPDKSSGHRVQDVHIMPASTSCRRALLPRCSITQQKAEQRDFHHAVLS